MEEPDVEREFRRLDHELRLIKIRTEIHESILLKVRVALHLYEIQSPPDPASVLRDAQDQVLQELEGIAAKAEANFLSASVYASLDDSERALFADEIRAMVDHMKAYVDPKFTGV